MTPLFFPFTRLPGAAACALLSCFERIALYSPSRELTAPALLSLEGEGRIELRLPETPDPDPLPALLKEYHSWGELHRGDRPDIHKYGISPAPPSDDTSAAWIRSKIRRMEAGADALGKPEDRCETLLLEARLFLAVAQVYDEQGASLSMDLNRIGDIEKALFHELSPDREELPALLQGEPLDDGPEVPMPEERLRAWARLHLHATADRAFPETAETPSPPLFVTSDRDILSLLLARVENPETVCRVPAIPVSESRKPSWNPDVSQRIESLIRKVSDGTPLSAAPDIAYAQPSNCHKKTACLTVYRLKQNPLPALLSGADGPCGSRDKVPQANGMQCFFLGGVSF